MTRGVVQYRDFRISVRNIFLVPPRNRYVASCEKTLENNINFEPF